MNTIVVTLAAAVLGSALPHYLGASERAPLDAIRLPLPPELEKSDSISGEPTVLTPLASNPFFSHARRSVKKPAGFTDIFTRPTILDDSGHLLPSAETCAVITELRAAIRKEYPPRDESDERSVNNFFLLILSTSFFEEILGKSPREEYLMAFLVYLQLCYAEFRKIATSSTRTSDLIRYLYTEAANVFAAKKYPLDTVVPISSKTRGLLIHTQNSLRKRLAEVTPLRPGQENQFTPEEHEAFRLFFEYVQYTHCYIFTKGCFPNNDHVYRLLLIVESEIGKFERKLGRSLFDDLGAFLKNARRKLLKLPQRAFDYFGKS